MPDAGTGTRCSSSSMIESVSDALPIGAEVGQHAVPQHRMGHGADVLEADVIAARRSARAPCRRGRDTARRGRWRRTAPTSSPTGACEPSAGWCGRASAHSAAPDRRSARAAPGAGTPPDPAPVVSAGIVRMGYRRRRAHDLELFVSGGCPDDDVEHEAIELGFGQRIGALELNRVLRREHEERLLQRVGPPLNRDASAPASPRAAATASWAGCG